MAEEDLFEALRSAFKNNNMEEVKKLITDSDEKTSSKEVEDLVSFIDQVQITLRKQKLKKHAVDTLRKIAYYLERDEYHKIQPYLVKYPGQNLLRQYIYINLSDTDTSMNISEVIEKLRTWK